MLFSEALDVVRGLIPGVHTSFTYEVCCRSTGELKGEARIVIVQGGAGYSFSGATWTECINKLRIHLEPTGESDISEAPEEVSHE